MIHHHRFFPNLPCAFFLPIDSSTTIPSSVRSSSLPSLLCHPSIILQPAVQYFFCIGGRDFRGSSSPGDETSSEKSPVRKESRFFHFLIQRPVNCDTFFNGDALVAVQKDLYIIRRFYSCIHQKISRLRTQDIGDHRFNSLSCKTHSLSIKRGRERLRSLLLLLLLATKLR